MALVKKRSRHESDSSLRRLLGRVVSSVIAGYIRDRIRWLIDLT